MILYLFLVQVVQLGSFVVLVVLMFEFCIQFATMGVVWAQVPAFGNAYTQVSSSVLYFHFINLTT